MAKAVVASIDDNRLTARIKGWPQRTKDFYNDVRTEMKKVTTPSLKEVQATTAVVIVTVFLFGIYFWVVDGAINRVLEPVFRYFGQH
jgi:preprotein translocase subunit SecE